MLARSLWLAGHAVWGRARANGGPVDAEGVATTGALPAAATDTPIRF